MIWALVYGGAGFAGAFLGTLSGGWVNTRILLRRLHAANAKLAREPNPWSGMPDRWIDPPGS